MDIPYIGQVEKDDQLDLYVSAPLVIEFLRGHLCTFALDGYFEDPRQVDFHHAIKNALIADHSILADAEPHVLQYRRETIALNGGDLLRADRIEDPTDVWKHVRFGDLFIVSRRDSGDEEDGIYLSLNCGCDWEIEHGLQIVLRNGTRITKIGMFDGHVTNSDAFGDPKLKRTIYRSAL